MRADSTCALSAAPKYTLLPTGHTAVQLLPPFLWEEPLPPVPDTPSALTLTLTPQDVEAIDADPAALGRRLAEMIRSKRWLRHPKAETYLAGRVALFQRVYRKS